MKRTPRPRTPDEYALKAVKYVKGVAKHFSPGRFRLSTGTWSKARQSKKHLMRMAHGTPGWDLATYKSLGKDLKVFQFTVVDGPTCFISREVFDAHSFNKNIANEEPQLFVDMKWWTCAAPGQGVLAL